MIKMRFHDQDAVPFYNRIYITINITYILPSKIGNLYISYVCNLILL